jgi:hypothetical protein
VDAYVITLDSDGKEHHWTVGFLAPEELIPSLLLGIAKVSFDADLFEGDLTSLNRLVSEYPESHASSEAIYYERGMSLQEHA